MEPTSSVRGGGAELSLSLPQRGAFNRLYEDWKSKGVHFLQEPKEAIYGMNFVVADLDNHRIRVFVSE
ncbi:VOC family protein [Enterovibrio coralii]|uniref:hypothetical protein n=1 Tax=Enterovibrio coralii TaxID=294935 RepID=UPI0038B87DC0